MSSAELDDVAAELYSVDPAEFVAARTSAAAAAKDSGNRKLAAAITKLRKPTTVGWMVNLLVREEPEDVADLFDLGDRLRDAQRRSAAGDLRELSADRQKSIRALSARAVEIAADRGRTTTEDAAREVGQTLGAALADPDVAERVRAGRVVTAESYSGFGPAVLSLAPEPTTSTDTAESEQPDEATHEEDTEAAARAAEVQAEARKRFDEARERFEEAREDEQAAENAAAAADAAAEAASTRLTEIKERLAQLRSELHDAEEHEADARKDEKSTERESRRLRRILTDAQARTAEQRAALDELDRQDS
ncbi:hypothetical protein [Rhodococcoides fascians]|uniref:hypothetical protein n=1 Tax=Rhodococcoides fascians TaxID=1828 RepID=UPI000560BF46|nr:hypothetical protein [Rhodococcus fascians]